jgi:hypothetical protein
MSHNQEHNPQLHTLGRRQLLNMQAVLLGPDMRIVEEGAIMGEGTCRLGRGQVRQGGRR